MRACCRSSRGRPGIWGNLLADYFDVPVEVEQFVGAWYQLDRSDPVLACDDGTDVSEQLGVGAVVGDEIWDTAVGACGCGSGRCGLAALSGLSAHADRRMPPLRALTEFLSRAAKSISKCN